MTILFGQSLWLVDAGSGRCLWRASTHPDQEMAKTGRSESFEEEDNEFDDKKQEFKTEGRKSGSSVEGEVLTMTLEPGTPSSPEESLATRLFTPEEGKSMEPHS
jgi:hypothetical protein